METGTSIVCNTVHCASVTLSINTSDLHIQTATAKVEG